MINLNYNVDISGVKLGRNEVESRLDKLSAAKKNKVWIRSDLTLSKSNVITRFFWKIIKSCPFCRKLFYKVDNNIANKNWLHIKTAIESHKDKELIEKFNKAFNTYCVEIRSMEEPVILAKSDSVGSGRVDPINEANLNTVVLNKSKKESYYNFFMDLIEDKRIFENINSSNKTYWVGCQDNKIVYLKESQKERAIAKIVTTREEVKRVDLEKKEERPDGEDSEALKNEEGPAEVQKPLIRVTYELLRNSTTPELEIALGNLSKYFEEILNNDAENIKDCILNTAYNLLPNKGMKEKSTFNLAPINQINLNGNKYNASKFPESSAELFLFWNRVFSTNSPLIVKLNQSQEEENYFPNAGYMIVLGDEFSLSTKNEEVLYDGLVIKRIMALTIDGKTKEIVHLEFNGWNDFDVPEEADFHLLLDEVSKCEKELINKGMAVLTKHPITVHCGAGIGRTGTFLIAHSNRAVKNPNIFKQIGKLREQRHCKMVETPQQLQFITKILKNK